MRGCTYRKSTAQAFAMSMITAAQWVPRGFAAPFPQKYQLDETEFERISGLAKLQLDDAEDDLKGAQDDGEGSSEENEDNDEMMNEKVEKLALQSKLVYSETHTCCCVKIKGVL